MLKDARLNLHLADSVQTPIQPITQIFIAASLRASGVWLIRYSLLVSFSCQEGISQTGMLDSAVIKQMKGREETQLTSYLGSLRSSVCEQSLACNLLAL